MANKAEENEYINTERDQETGSQENVALNELFDQIESKHESERSFYKTDDIQYLNNRFSLKLYRALKIESSLPDISSYPPMLKLEIIQLYLVNAVNSCFPGKKCQPFSLCYPIIDKFYIIPMASETINEADCIAAIHEICHKFGQKVTIQNRLVNAFKMHRYNNCFNIRDVRPYTLNSEDKLIIDEAALGKYYKDMGYVFDGKSFWRQTTNENIKVDDREIGQQLAKILKPEFCGRNCLISVIWTIKNLCYECNFNAKDSSKIHCVDLANPSQFIYDLFDFDDAGFPISELYTLYQEYCKLKGTRAYSRRDFINEVLSIPELKKKQYNHDNCRCISGINLSEEKMIDFKVGDCVFPRYTIDYFLAQMRFNKNKNRDS